MGDRHETPFRPDQHARHTAWLYVAHIHLCHGMSSMQIGHSEFSSTTRRFISSCATADTTTPCPFPSSFQVFAPSTWFFSRDALRHGTAGCATRPQRSGVRGNCGLCTDLGQSPPPPDAVAVAEVLALPALCFPPCATLLKCEQPVAARSLEITPPAGAELPHPWWARSWSLVRSK